jgi:hypothetical protein
MTRRLCLIAAAAAFCAGSAIAAPNTNRIAISSGASAVKGNFGLALQSLCSSAGGTFTEFTSGGNISTYVCANSTVTSGAGGTYTSKPNGEFINFNGTAFAEVRLNVGNGSFTSVCLIQPGGWPAPGTTACPAADTYFNPTAAALAAAPAGSVVVGGVLDVEPSAWPAGVLAGLTVPAASALQVAQAFGLAVSSSLYTKLFNAQLSTGDATVSKPIPAGCTVADTGKLQCVPTVSRAAMATVMAGDEFNTAGANGVGFLTGDAAQNGQNLVYARRVDTSGTQSAAQVFFLGQPCMRAPLSIAAGGTIAGAVDVRNLGGTGDVRTVLNTAGIDAIGIMSGENNQTGQSWRWVRINGAPLGENAAPSSAGITNRVTMLNGAYDFWFEATFVSAGSASANAFWTALSGSLNTLTAPIGLINRAQLEAAGNFKKSGASCSYSVGN